MTEHHARRRGRRALAWGGAALAILLLLVALAPTLVNWVGRGAVAGYAQRHVNGTVHLHALRVGWFGAQSVTAEVADERTVARVEVTVDAGLAALLTDRSRALHVDLGGRLSGELYPNGATSFVDLLVKREPQAGGKGAAPPGGPTRLPWAGPVTVSVSDLDVELRESPSGRVLVLENLAGELTSRPGQRVTVDLTGAVIGEGAVAGSVKLAADLAGLFDAAGSLTLDQASGRVDLTLRDTPVPLMDRPAELKAMTLTARAEDLTDRLDLIVESDAVIDGTRTGHLTGELSIAEPVRVGGAVRFQDWLYGVTGEVTGRTVPSVLFQEALRRAPVPIVAARDLGPTLDIDASFSSGRTHDVTVRARGESMELAMSGAVDPQGALRLDELHLSATVDPQLVEAATGVRIDQPTRMILDVDELSVPADRRHLSAAGTVTVPAEVTAAGMPFSQTRMRFETADLAGGATVTGSALLDGAPASVELTLDDLLDEDGALAATRLRAGGTVTVQGLPAARVAALLPGRADLIGAALTEPVDLSATFSHDGGAQTLDATVTSGAARVSAEARRAEGTVHVTRAAGTMVVTPELFAALQAGAERPLVLAAPAGLAFELEPFDVANRRVDRVTGRVAVERAVLDEVPGFDEPIAVGDLVADADVALEPLAVAAEGTARVGGAGVDEPVASIRAAFNGTRRGDAYELSGLSLDVTDLSVARLDALTGRSLAGWLGDRGAVTLGLHQTGSGYRASVAADFPGRLAGDFAVESDGGMISVTAREPVVTLSKEAVQQRLAPPPAPQRQAGGTPPAPLITVAADVPLTLDVRTLRFPLALVNGKPFDGADVDIDVTMTGGPLVLDDPRTGRNTIDRLAIGLAGDDLAEGLAVNVAGRVSFAGAAEPGRIELDGEIRDLMRDGVLAASDARTVMTARVEGLHAAVIDAAANMKGLLVAALGARVDAEATADHFSRNTGTLAATVVTPNGRMEGIAHGRDNALYIDAGSPVRAQLEITPPLRERLLRSLHPLLADIRQTEQPLQATIGNALVPLDGKVSRLQADIDITVGQVEFDSGSVTLALLAIGKTANARTLPGYVEPIRARIRGGVVTYERFAVQIDKYTLVYSGTVDLNTRAVNLRTEVPLDALAQTFHELEGYTEGLVAPLITKGTIDDPKTEVDPEFLAEAAAKAGLNRLLKEADEETGVPISDIFDGIFGKKKKKE